MDTWLHRLACLSFGLGLALPAAAEVLIRPAEIPPASYAGQQYVDSRGCMFVRAGTDKEVLWILRVNRKGEPQCGNPPSGRRVPVVGETGGAATEAGTASADIATPDTVPKQPAEIGVGSYFVAVGSFVVAANADAAEMRLKAMNYSVARGQLQGGNSALVTVFAGPFADAQAAARAQSELRGAGFPDAIVMRN
jgi:SPOR domain